MVVASFMVRVSAGNGIAIKREIMSKTKNVAAAAAEEFKPPFAVAAVGAPPATTRAVGARGDDPIRGTLEWMKTQASPATVEQSISFFVPAAAADSNITDADEREKAAKDNQRKLANKISGMFRRITKDTSVVLVQRAVSEKVDGHGDEPVRGVRVYRTPDAATPAAAEAQTSGDAPAINPAA